MEAVERYLETNRAAIGERLRLLVGDGERPAPTGKAFMVALARALADSGLLVQPPARPTRPLIAASGDQDRPRVLLFFHSDATEPAAEPGGARASLVAALAALGAVYETAGRLPAGVVLVCEPDRARGSISLEGVHLPAVHACLWDGGGYSATQPWLALGSQGLLRLTLRARGPGGPVSLGGVVPNPAWRLIWALAALKSVGEEVLVPGFYEPVREPTSDEVALLAEQASDLAARVEHLAGTPLLGLSGPHLALVQAFSPTLNVTDLGVSVATPGHLPTSAWAEVSLTLVPNQTPTDALAAVEELLRARGLADVTVEVVTGYAGWETPADAPLVRLVREEATGLLGHRPSLRPFAEHPAPLARLARETACPMVGLGPGRAPWPVLEERVVLLARLVAALLPRLAEPLSG